MQRKRHATRITARVQPQVIGPQSTPYHKSCLVCITCNKRLDSMLLVEHDGQPLCKNCHRNHLGQGKGGFAKAVPVRGTLPVGADVGGSGSRAASVPSSPTKRSVDSGPQWQYGSDGGDSTGQHEEEDLARRFMGVNVTPRPQGAEATSSGRLSPERRQAATMHGSAGSPPRSGGPSSLMNTVSSIDDAVYSGAPMPNITPRNAALRGQMDELNTAMSGGGSRIGTQPLERGSSSSESSSGTSARRPLPTIPTSPGGYSTPPPPSRSPTRWSASTESAPIQPPSPTRPSQITPIPSGASPPQTGESRRLPSPVRRMPVSASTNSYKTASGQSTEASRSAAAMPSSASSPFRGQYGNSPASTQTRIANAVGSGTPLCARCSKPAYFAEAVSGATTGGRVWHRACLKCESCGTTLQKGTVQEGPFEEAEQYGQGMNTFCRVCHRKIFGPKGIGNAGMSFPTAR